MRREIILNGFYTIFRREAARIIRIWPQTLLPPLITQSLYFVIFGGFIGSRVGLVEGVPYMAFVVPGLIMMAVIQNSFMNVVSSFFSSKFMKSIQEIQVSPTPEWVMLAGYVAGGVFRGMLIGIIVWGVTALFVDLPVAHIGLVILFLLLTSILFSLAGFLNSIFAKKFDDISIFSTFVLVPLTYLGGVFYGVSQLPPFWQAVSKANPILYMVDGFRYGFFGTSGIAPWTSLAVITAVVIALTWTNLYFLKKGTGMRA